MILKNINIKNFRNYETLDISFSPGINIVYGENAQGKTNLLESIYVLALTKSHRSFIDNNLIKHGENYLKIKGVLEENNIDSILELSLINNKKKLKIDNDDIKKTSDYISKMNIIIFYPEDLNLIKGSPTERRRYLNIELSQLNNGYYNLISDYNKLLKIRNDYLKKGIQDKNYFDVLTTYLIDKAVQIYKIRYKYINKINEIVINTYQKIMNLTNFKIIYKTSIDLEDLDNLNLKTKLINKFKKMEETEIRLGTTMVGPHRDDIEFYLEDKNLKNYGSQGQQRIAILALKLSEIELFKKYKNTQPILLLDDVFSELDDIKKNNLLYYINDDIQTIITTTELTNIDSNLLKNAKLIQIYNGKITRGD